MSPNVKIRDRDRGYRKLLRRVARLAGHQPSVGVGVTGESGAEAAKGDGRLTLLDVATFNEFGTRTIPQRSFIRAWFDEKLPVNRRKVKRIAQLVVAGKLTEERALELLGIEFQASIQERITRGIAPANADSTVRKKGSSKPLIDTGQLRQGISYEVKL